MVALSVFRLPMNFAQTTADAVSYFFLGSVCSAVSTEVSRCSWPDVCPLACFVLFTANRVVCVVN